MLNMFRTLIYLSSGVATILSNYHTGRIVLGWSGIRVAGFSLQPLQPNHTETPTRIEPRTIRPMW